MERKLEEQMKYPCWIQNTFVIALPGDGLFKKERAGAWGGTSGPLSPAGGGTFRLQAG